MATKSGMTDKKRKADPSSKVKTMDSGAKKARLNDASKKSAKPPKAVEEEEEDDFESFSDSEDGGAPLERSHKFDPSKAGDKSNGKAFERTTGETSRESHAKQKKLAAERKAAKPLADEVQRSKKIWEQLRRKAHLPAEERQQLVEQLFSVITGRMTDFVLKHDAVRVVQTALKYGTAEQRRTIAKELKGTYAQLAESRYAKFLLGKLIVTGDKETRDLIIPEFYGKVRKLINHPEASWILDDVYRQVATKEQKAILLREWYGPEFSIKELNKEAAPTADLKEILAKEPGKRGPITKSLGAMINSLVQKNMTGFTMLHDAMLQYFSCLEPGTEEFKEFFELVKGEEAGDLLKNMAFTRSGARLVCLLLAYGTPKDRKNFLKTYKETFLMMSADQHAHTIILVAYDVIDDTKLTAKSIFPELLGDDMDAKVVNTVAAANSSDARKTILYLTQGLHKSLFPSKTAFDYKILEEVREIRKTFSKKDEDLREKELLEAFSPQLLEVIAAAPADFLSTPFGCHFVTEIIFSGIGEKQAALESLAEIAKGDPAQEQSEDDLVPVGVHISQTALGSRLLKSLIQGGKWDKDARKVVPTETPLNFSNILYPAIKDHVVAWATTAGSFIIVALLEAADFEHADELRKTLKKNKKALEKAAKEMTAEQKAREELAATEPKGGKGAKAKKERGEKPVGNMGSKLLLEKL